MAISTVNVDFSAILQNAATATGLLRVRLSQVGTVEDSETGDTVILPIAWQETTLTDGAATLALVPNKIIEPSCTYYEIQLKSVPDCPKACAKLLLSGIMYVPDEDCNVLDLLISPPSPETANTASGYASQAKQAAQVAENFAVQAGDRYDDVAEAAATALTDIGTAKQDALDAIGTAQSGATEAISTAEDAALQAIGQARGAALDDIGTAQGTATAAVQAEGNTQVGRVYDAGEDSVADVTAAQAAAVSAVQAQQATSVEAVSAEGTAQVNAVTQAGNGYVATMQGLVSDAQAARDAAQTAQGLAEDAQAAAESASTDAQGYAGDASTSAGQAAQSASDAADSATAAQASAESIAASAAQIQTNEQNITNIQALLNGTLYREETDSTAAYSKSVPTGALPYASVDMIGGRTIVWNQLVDNAASFTVLSGENKTYTFLPQQQNQTIISNHTYLILYNQDVAMTSNVRNTLRIYNYTTNQYVATESYSENYNLSAGQKFWLYTSTFTGIGGFQIWCHTPDVTVTYSDFRIHDLTLMFGSGNEPSTVAEFQAQFPTIDPAYNAGELKSAGVTEAVSKYKTVVWNQGVNPALFVRTTADGITTEINLQTSLITITNNSRDTLYQMGSTRGELHENLTVGHKYICIGQSTRSLTGLAISCFYGSSWYDVILNNIFTNEQDVDRVNFRITAQYDFISEHPIGDVMTLTVSLIDLTQMFGAGNEPATVAEFEAMFPYLDLAYNAGTEISYNIAHNQGVAAALEIGSILDTLPIPSAIQALPGYGWSAGTAYNVVSLAQGKNTQRVGRVDLGDLTWYTYTQNTVSGFYTDGLIGDKALNMNFVCDKYVNAKNGLDSIPDKSCGTWNLGDLRNRIVIRDSAYTDAAAFKTAMQGVMLQYELATPIETDISSLLTDTAIEVEAGGTLTFKNQHGDDWRVPVPNEETYLVQATPELPSADGTYTLQCTVTDGTPSVTWVTA